MEHDAVLAQYMLLLIQLLLLLLMPAVKHIRPLARVPPVVLLELP
jgi:hypothetical protein